MDFLHYRNCYILHVYDNEYYKWCFILNLKFSMKKSIYIYSIVYVYIYTFLINVYLTQKI